MEKVWKQIGGNKVAVYVAEDGSELLSPFHCARYEIRLKAIKAEPVVKNLPQFSSCPPDFDYGCGITFYKVGSKVELEAVKAVSFPDPDASGWAFDLEDYPCWVCALVDSENGCGVMATADSVIKDAEAYLAELKSELLTADQNAGKSGEGV